MGQSDVISSDPHMDARRPIFHVMSDQGWASDPSGPIFFKGKYHMWAPGAADPSAAAGGRAIGGSAGGVQRMEASAAAFGHAWQHLQPDPQLLLPVLCVLQLLPAQPALLPVALGPGVGPRGQRRPGACRARALPPPALQGLLPAMCSLRLACTHQAPAAAATPAGALAEAPTRHPAHSWLVRRRWLLHRCAW
jgi:hypothetical protein